MATSSKSTPARVLLDFLSPDLVGTMRTDVEANQAMADLVAEIVALDLQHNRQKKITQQQLAEQVFGRSRIFKDRKALVPYLRYQLRTALEELEILYQEMKNQNNGAITVTALTQYSPILNDFLFDLLEILTPLQQSVPGWEFFSGGKNSSVSSWEVFILARGLAFQSTWTGVGPFFDHKASQIASIGVLRQAMELRFERLIAVYPIDPKGKPPKIRHGFHQEFIAAHPRFFNSDGFAIKELRHLYDWCSEIVHQAYQPYAWQVCMALRRSGDLLRSRSKPSGEAWSIYNAVEIVDVEAMQTAYEDHFLSTYGHGTWQMIRRRPEASVPNWRSDMAFAGGDYRPALNRPPLWDRIKRRIRNLINQI
jgi:hypothetical protein